MAQVIIANPEETWAAVAELRSKESPIDYLLFEYKAGSRSTVQMCEKGSGGLQNLVPKLPSSGIRFILFELVASGDQQATRYDATKYIFCTWIGKETPAGIDKARSAADAPQLIEQLNGKIAVGGVMQATTESELNYEDAASKVLQLSTAYVAASPRSASQAALKPTTAVTAAPSKRTSALTFADSCKEGLTRIKNGTSKWAQLCYSETTKGLIELGKEGNGNASEIAALFDPNKISYVVVTVEMTADGVQKQNIKKTIVVTMIGEHVPPLAKSRSAGNRQDLLDFVLSVLPYHFHYQPLDASQITDEELNNKVAK